MEKNHFPIQKITLERVIQIFSSAIEPDLADAHTDAELVRTYFDEVLRTLITLHETAREEATRDASSYEPLVNTVKSLQRLITRKNWELVHYLGEDRDASRLQQYLIKLSFSFNRKEKERLKGCRTAYLEMDEVLDTFKETILKEEHQYKHRSHDLPTV